MNKTEQVYMYNEYELPIEEFMEKLGLETEPLTVTISYFSRQVRITCRQNKGKKDA